MRPRSSLLLRHTRLSGCSQGLWGGSRPFPLALGQAEAPPRPNLSSMVAASQPCCLRAHHWPRAAFLTTAWPGDHQAATGPDYHHWGRAPGLGLLPAALACPAPRLGAAGQALAGEALALVVSWQEPFVYMTSLRLKYHTAKQCLLCFTVMWLLNETLIVSHFIFIYTWNYLVFKSCHWPFSLQHVLYAIWQQERLKI